MIKHGLYALGICLTYIIFILKIIECLVINVEQKQKKNYSIILLLIIGITSFFICKFIKNKKIKYGISIAGIILFSYGITQNKNKTLNLLNSGLLLLLMLWISTRDIKNANNIN